MTFLLKALFNYTISAIMCVNKKAIDRNKLRLWPFFYFTASPFSTRQAPTPRILLM